MQSNQPNKSIKPDEMLDALLLLQVVIQGDLAVQQGRTKPLKQAFAEHRERMKVIHENILNNNHTGSRERH